MPSQFAGMVWARFGGILHSYGVLADMSCSANPVSVCLRAGVYLCADGCIAKAQTKICDAVIKEEGYGYGGTYQATILALFGLVSRCVQFCREQ